LAAEMNFAFVPNGAKGDFGIAAAARFLQVRVPAAGRVPRAKTNLQDILDWIDVATPAGDEVETVFLVSHASEQHVSFLFTAGQTDPSVYTVLVDIQGPSSPFRAPIRFRSTPPAGATPIQIVIKGCRIGESEAFLRLLKTLMGGQLLVTAPRHFNVFFGVENKNSSFVIDCLSYNRELHRKVPITKYPDLVSAFTSAGFTRYDGSTQPLGEMVNLFDQLQKPVKLALKTYLPTASTTAELKRPLRIKVKFNEPIAGEMSYALKKIAEYRAQRVRKTVARMDMTAFSAKPVVDHLTDAIAKWDARYLSQNVAGGTVRKTFGEHLGLHKGEAIDDYVVWSDEPDKDKATGAKGRKIVGTFFRYQLIQPVTSVADGTLLFDSQKERGAALMTPTTWPTVPAEIAALFRTV
jgi:hypothetical protein